MVVTFLFYISRTAKLSLRLCSFIMFQLFDWKILSEFTFLQLFVPALGYIDFVSYDVFATSPKIFFIAKSKGSHVDCKCG